MSAQLQGLVRWLLADLTGVRAFDGAQVAEASALLGRLAAALGVADGAAKEPLQLPVWRYQTRVLRSALEGEAAQLLGTTAAGRWALELGRPVAEELSLVSGRMRRVVNVNAAAEQELAGLRGLGPRRVASLLARTPYRDLEAARRGAGLGPKAWAEIAPFLEAGSAEAPPKADVATTGAPLRTLVQGIASGSLIHPAIGDAATPASEIALSAVRYCARRSGARRLVPPYWTPSARRLRLGVRALAQERERERMAAAAVALVRNAAYPQLLGDLIASAAASIRVAMFFIAAEEQGVVDSVVAALAGARSRGVDVRVLLGDDLPGDRHGAGIVNAAARRDLRAHRVPFRLSWPEIALHEKAVVVDGRHVLAGSHNWTASSFHRYDETSVYLDSPELAAWLERRFDSRWRMLADRPSRRRIPLAGLELVPPELAERLAGRGILYGDQLPADARGLRAVARADGGGQALLGRVRDIAGLMREFRVSEVTAASLVTARLRTPDAVRSTSVRRLEHALARPLALPEPLRGRRVFPGVLALLTEAV